MTTPSAVAVLELARIAAMCRWQSAAYVQDQITARVHVLADEPVNELNRLAEFASGTTSVREIRMEARRRIAALRVGTRFTLLKGPST